MPGLPPQGGCPRQGCPSYCQVAPATPRQACPSSGCPPPGLPPPALPGEAGPKTRDPSIGGPVKKDQAGPEKSGGRAFRAWPSPFCHMNELGSGIGLEGVLNTVWVKQMVPLPVDPVPAIGKTRAVSPLDRGAVGSKPEKGGSLGGWGGIRCTEAARPAATPWRGSGPRHFGTP